MTARPQPIEPAARWQTAQLLPPTAPCFTRILAAYLPMLQDGMQAGGANSKDPRMKEAMYQEEMSHSRHKQMKTLTRLSCSNMPKMTSTSCPQPWPIAHLFNHSYGRIPSKHCASWTQELYIFFKLEQQPKQENSYHLRSSLTSETLSTNPGETEFMGASPFFPDLLYSCPVSSLHSLIRPERMRPEYT